MFELFLSGLTRLNIILAGATVLVAFSLLAYLFFYNFRNRVARTFVAVLAFVTMVYIGDVFLATARLEASDPAAAFWLRFQWLGIAFVAPAYLHFSDALLATTGDRARWRRWAILAAYGLGALALAGVVDGHGIVGLPVGLPGAVRFTSGPLFGLFALGYWLVAGWAARNVWHARSRALTERSRWRMSYLLVSVIAPISAFPFLTAGGGELASNVLAWRLTAAAASIATAAMTVVVAYSVAYHGALTPDRAIKRDIIKYLIQGPVLGFFVIATTQLIPVRLETNLGLPRDLVLVLAVVVGIVAFQFVVRALKPLVDWLIFSGEGRDAMWLKRLDERLISTTDLTQLLENILTAMCDQLRVDTGCVVVFDMETGEAQVEAFAGSREESVNLLASLDADAVAKLAADEPLPVVDGFRVHPLRPVAGGGTLGLLAIRDPGRPLAAEELLAFGALIDSAERGLEDRLIQQRVIASLRALEPELTGLQRLRGALERGSRTLERLETLRAVGDGVADGAERPNPLDAELIDDADFPHWVKDALQHYWGGPKLSESPLLGLSVVREALKTNDFNRGRAVRSVLDRAIEDLKPDGERSLTASGWLIYNILELRFVRGLRVRDIARRLALSESDLYRKQRVAVEALAGQLAAMEAQQMAPVDAGPDLASDAKPT